MTAEEIIPRLKSNWRLKAVLTFVLPGVFLTIYSFLQRHPQFPVVPAPSTWLDPKIPFIPGAVYLYQSIWLLIPIAPWLMATKEEMQRFVLCCALISLGGFVVFFFFPTSNPRPRDLQDVNMLYAIMAQLDLGLNSFPSHHVAWTVFSGACSHVVICERGHYKSLQLFLWIWVSAVVASTLLTKQHYLLDTVAGAALGFGGFAIGRLILIGDTAQRQIR